MSIENSENQLWRVKFFYSYLSQNFYSFFSRPSLSLKKCNSFPACLHIPLFCCRFYSSLHPFLSAVTIQIWSETSLLSCILSDAPASRLPAASGASVPCSASLFPTASPPRLYALWDHRACLYQIIMVFPCLVVVAELVLQVISMFFLGIEPLILNCPPSFSGFWQFFYSPFCYRQVCQEIEWVFFFLIIKYDLILETF